MPKNIVICCDGTGNEISNALTNVFRLFHVLVHNSPDQVSFYLPGVGTMEKEGLARRIAQSSGYGVYANAERVMSFIMQNHAKGDKLFLVGFNRGACTLQVVAALLHMWGLFRNGTEHVVPYAIRLTSKIPQEVNSRQREDFAKIRTSKDTFSQCECPMHFMGMWDSVSSGGGIRANPLGMPFISTNPSILAGRHAIAIDERRAFLGVELWQSQSPNIKQVWFPSVHADVGGGYPEPERGLAKISFQ